MVHLHPVDTARRTGVPGNPLADGGVYRVGGGALDDAEAVALAQRGDLDAYEHLVGKYTAAAHRAAALLGAGDDADDVVQEAFVKAYRKLRLCRTGDTFRPWLLAIVANETRNLHRSRRRRDALVLKASARAGEPVTGPDEPAAAALAAERRQQLTAALGTLDDLHRDVLICRYLLDLSEQETADALGCSRGTVKSRTFRALGRLRTRLDAGRREEVDRA
jgi:RNA polymerase sigma factor (sigma-70 family)